MTFPSQPNRALAARLLRHIHGGDFRIAAVHFPHAAPASYSEYQRCFAAPVLFDTDSVALRIPRDVLLCPRGPADDDLSCMQESLARRQVDELCEPSITARVAEVIRTLLPSGRCNRFEVARLLSMSERTLQRRLVEEGTGFSSVMDRVRQNVALETLHDSDGQVALAAYRTGYGELKSFHRAFRRWTNTTPGRLRRGLRTG